MTKLIKILAILSLLIFVTGCEEKPIGKITKDTYNLKSDMDPRLKAYPEAVEWYDSSMISKKSAFNLGLFYDKKLKDKDSSIIWYKRAYNLGDNNSAINIGAIYENSLNYDDAIKWYLLANNNISLTNLGLLYEKLEDYTSAKKYYKIAIERESIDSINNIAVLYYKEKNYIKSSAYLLTLIEYPNYTKEEVLNYLRNDLKIDNETIKKGYELQLTMPGLPRRYKGGI